MLDGSITVMLVDDNLTNLKIGREVLGRQYNVLTVPSGGRMFELLEKVSPQVILLDLLMPDMDGWTVLQRLKSDEALCRIPVLVCSGKASAAGEAESLRLGATGYLQKPFTAEELQRQVAACLAPS